MLRNIRITLLSLTLLLALSGCESDRSTRHLTAPDKDAFDVLLDPFKVVFAGRTFADGQTTFAWTLRGPGNQPVSRSMVIELPECAPEPLSISPAANAAVGWHPETEIFGVVWDLQTDSDNQGARTYTITFPGDVPLGEVHAALTQGTETTVSTLPGPCQGFEISGQVFIDADGDGVQSEDEELGIAGVLVELSDQQGRTLGVVTGQDGAFVFHRFAGDYTLSIDLENTDYFNAQLTASFEATTPLVREITVGPDSPDNDFGFNTLVDEVVEDIVQGDLQTDGYTRQYWREQVRLALVSGDYHETWQGKTLLDLLTEVQDLALREPFRFTPGQEYEQALRLLSPDPQDAYLSLQGELLATELNYTISRGLVEGDDLQLVLIGWGEALLVQNQVRQGAADGQGSLRRPGSRASEYQLFDARRLFENINTGGGGGIDE